MKEGFDDLIALNVALAFRVSLAANRSSAAVAPPARGDRVEKGYYDLVSLNVAHAFGVGLAACRSSAALTPPARGGAQGGSRGGGSGVRCVSGQVVFDMPIFTVREKI